jgi:hypothetical protein
MPHPINSGKYKDPYDIEEMPKKSKSENPGNSGC